MTADSGPGEVLRVAIVDDHRLLVEALALALEGYAVHATAPELDDPAGLVDHLVGMRPALVLLDLDLGSAGDGSLLVRPLVEAGLRVLLVTAGTDVEQVARAVQEGAIGVVGKDGPFSALVDGVVAAAHGREVMAPRDRLHLLDEGRDHQEHAMAALAPFGHLTRREAEVLRELAEGRTVTEIAHRAGVKEATVRSQVQAIFTKLGVRSQLEAVVAAQRSGWV